MAVILPIKLSGEPIKALLDSGAGPSVIDVETLRDLRFDQYMDIGESELYGLSHEPVKVIGSLKLLVDLGDNQTIEHTFEVFSETEPTCILGRNFLKKFGTTEFDWSKNQVRLGKFGRPHK